MRTIKRLIKKVRTTKPVLFDGDNTMFINNSREICKYAEYGVGLSTEWIFSHTNADILSVETDEEWLKTVKKNINYNRRVVFAYFDLGAVENWGRPITYTRRHYFSGYINSIWQTKNFVPDLVLIDGRFRVACFLTALINAVPKTKIIFDDYTNRSCYHIVEEFISPIETCGRQALFIVPDTVNNVSEIKELINKFEYVFD